MKRGKSRLLAGLLSMSMIFSVINAPIEALAATDTSGHWAEASINNWINRGYISGYPDGTFRPNNAISRAEFVTIANKAFGFTSSQGISFSDVKPGYWAYSEIQKGVAAGYVQGDTKGTFRPGSAVSRQEAAVMLARLRGYENDETGAYNYTDRWAMANWAVGAIGAVSRNGVMSGYPDGTFRPQKDLTRAEAVASLQKIANSSNSFGNTGTITNSNYNTNNNSYTPPVYVTPSSSTSSSSNNSSSNTISNTRSSGGRTVLDGTRLENRTLTTDLEIPRSVGSQNVTLKNIRMRGTLYVRGGGTITLENCDIGTVIMDKTDAVLKNNGSSDVEEVRFEQRGRIDGKGYMNVLIDDDSVSEVIIDADIDTLTLDADVDLRLYANANIDTFEITKNADRARIRVGEDAEITEMQIYDKVRISGKGKIDTMTVYVSGVQSSIEPRRLIQQDGARKPSFSYQDDDDDYDNLVIDDDDEDFDGDGERYNRVRIAAEDVRIRDLTAYDDLIVTSAAGDSTIRIEDVTVKGNVYIEGGGDSSVIFDDCSISGNIYSRKSTSGRYDEPVAIKLRDTSVKGDVYVTGDTILESDEKLNKVILNRELSETFRMDAEAANLTINYKNNVQLRGSKTIDSVDVASGLSNVTLTMNGGKISTLTTRSPIRIDGTGTIDRLLTNQTNDIGSNITVGSIGEVGDDPSAASYAMTSFVSDNSSSYGSISPLGQQTVANGGTMAYSITANSGYHVASIVVDSREINLENKLYSGYTYTFYNVKANHEIIVSFAEGAGTDGTGSASNGTNSGDNNNDNNTPSEDGYRISTNVNGTGGGVSDEFVVVKDGEDASVTFTAGKGYHISEIVIDAGTDNEKSLRRISESSETYSKVTYTFVNVTRNHTISATFADGQGTNEVGIRSTDEDAPVIKPSGYKYKVTTMLVGDDGKELVKNTDGRYYCIAGDTVTLRMVNLETDDPNEQYLTTKWSIVNNTTDMRMELTQADNSPHAVLTTTANNGHAVMLRVQVFDTSKESNISAPVYQSDVIELHVDVPMTDLMLSNSDELYCQNYEYVLSSQNFTYIPSTATAANDRQNIQWTIVEEHINDVDPIELQTKKEVRIAQKAMGNGSTVPSLLVEQSQRETADSSQERNITQPIGTVVIRATIPNGKGKMQDFTKEFTIQFIGSKVIPVTALRLNNDDKKKEIFGIADLDLNTIRAEIIPSDATYKQIEWRIASQEGVREELGTVEKDKNYETKLVTNGYSGIIKLRPFIRNGKGAGEDFDPDIDGEEVEVTVKVIEPTVTMNRVVAENGTDIGDVIELSAQVTNAARTPYTQITGWQKTYKENAKENDWESIPAVIDLEDVESPDDNGVYYVGYEVIENDLNKDNYVPKKVYFRAVVEYDKDYDPNITEQTAKNVAYSNVISVDCQAQEIKLPAKTDIGINGNGQNISVNANKECTIQGYDKITLLDKLDNGTPITWSITPNDKPLVATLDTSTNGRQVLTLKGQPEQQIELTATVPNKGTTTFNITNKFVPIEVNQSGFDIVNASGSVEVTYPEDEIQLMVGNRGVKPFNATYHAYTGDDKVVWSIGTKADGSDAKAIEPQPTQNADGAYVYKLPDKNTIETDASGKIYFTASWKNGTLTSGGNIISTKSRAQGLEIRKEIEPVTGIDFSETGMRDVTLDNGNYKYTIEVTDDTSENGILINLDSAKVIPANATNQDMRWSAVGGNINEEIASFENKTIRVPKNTRGGEFAINLSIENGLGQDRPYTTTLTITVTTTVTPAPSGGTQTTSTYQPEAIVDEPNNSNATNNAADSSSNATNSNNNVTDNSNNATNNAADSNNNATNNTVSNIADNSNNAINNVADSNNETTGIPDANGFVPVTDISFSSVVGLQPTAQPNVYNVTSNKTQRTLVNLNDIVDEVSGAHTGGVKVLPTNATNQTVTWSVGKGTPVIPSTMTNMTYITSIGRLNKQTGALNIDENVTGTLVLVATVKNGKGEEIDFTKQITINISPTAVTTPSVPTTPTVTPTTPSTSTTTEPVNQMPENTTQATTRQVVSVGNTQLGASSTQSTGLSQSKSDVYATDTSTIKSTTSNEDVKIEVSSQAKKGIRIPLKAVSKSTNKEYTDVDWEVKDDGGTDAKIENGNRLRATKAGTVTVQAIVYTSSGDRMVCSTDVTISN